MLAALCLPVLFLLFVATLAGPYVADSVRDMPYPHPDDGDVSAVSYVIFMVLMAVRLRDML
jgi:hypothetical protein